MSTRNKGFFVAGILILTLWGLYPTYDAYREGGNPQAIKNKVNLGLDLQGGMYLDLEVDVDAAVIRMMDLLATELEDTLLEKLVDYLHVERRGETVEVALSPGEKVDWQIEPFSRLTSDVQVVPLDGNTFHFKLSKEESAQIRKDSVDQALEVIRNRIDFLGVSEPSLQKHGETDLLIQLPGLKDRDSAIRAIGTQAVLEFYLVEDNVTKATMDSSRHVLKFEDVRDETTGKTIDQIPFILERRPVLAGDTVRNAKVQISSLDNTPYVGISFNSVGSDRFAKITNRNKGRRLAIVLDDKVQSAPVIREAITGGEAQISGGFTLREASGLAIVLRSGSLPAPITIREERTVGSTLGEDSIRQGLFSLGAGGLLVVLFMLIYYRAPGSFAGLALIFNLLLILVVLASFGATLTLPGIAGIVLTMGMSVDANVLIFERIREELSLNGNARVAVEEGFGKAFWTIFDSNLTTLVASLALMAFGTGPIKGFAVTLSIGILASMFTAIVVTRLLFEIFYLRKRNLKEISI